MHEGLINIINLMYINIFTVPIAARKHGGHVLLSISASNFFGFNFVVKAPLYDSVHICLLYWTQTTAEGVH